MITVMVDSNNSDN